MPLWLLTKTGSRDRPPGVRTGGSTSHNRSGLSRRFFQVSLRWLEKRLIPLEGYRDRLGTPLLPA